MKASSYRLRPQPFSLRDEAALVRVAEAAMPAGEHLAGAGLRCVDKVAHFLAEAPAPLASAYRALLFGLSADARLHTGRPLEGLSRSSCLALLERWSHGSYARRSALRLLLAPLKMAHYHDREIFGQAGCRFGALPVLAHEPPREAARITAAAALCEHEEVECEVVVVGTGAGGAVVARELAEKGHAVVLLEEGDYVRRAEFSGHGAAMQARLYRDMGATVAFGNLSIPIPIGKSVGGTTTINSGTCYRTPDRVLRDWGAHYGLTQLTPEAMAPYFERVEQVLEVAEADPRHLGGVARVIARGCDALGYVHRPLRRNAPACDGQGVCCFGCPTDAKRSTNVSYVPLALRAGAHLYTGVRVERILTEHGCAVGVVAHAAGGKRLRVRARAVVVACGALQTPLLLEENGLGKGSGQLGHNLSIHPAIALMALYDEVIDGAHAIPQGYAIEEFKDDGILFEGAFAPLDLTAASLPLIGPALVDLLERYDHLACFGLLIEDSSRGRVRRGPGGRPLISYMLNDNDLALLKRGAEILGRVYLASGAQRVLPMVHGFDEWRDEQDLERFRRARLHARDFEVSAYHPLGTARMGVDPRSSVVGPDHQVHDLPGLYVADGSVVPSSPGVNPQITIMALATRAAESISAALG